MPGGRRVLIVDDNAELADNLAEVLGGCGHAVRTANDGPGALRVLENEPFDRLISNVRMPRMNGIALLHEVRARDAGLPAILISGYTPTIELIPARFDGVLAVLPKPVPVPRLIRLVEIARRGVVVLVDGNQLLTENLSEAFGDLGFTTVVANPLDELERIGDVSPFVLVGDARVPRGALQRLAARFPTVPTVTLSVAEEPAPIASVARFRKPFDTGELLRAVERCYQQTLRS